jgi:diketogulonate reductase-like aldo/keto reductase
MSQPKSFCQNLERLTTRLFDLYLIHWPANSKQFANWQSINAETWRALEDLYKEGYIKAIGVSNFMVNHLQALLKTAEIAPMVNQIEFHRVIVKPKWWSFVSKTIFWCKLGVRSVQAKC